MLIITLISPIITSDYSTFPPIFPFSPIPNPMKSNHESGSVTGDQSTLAVVWPPAHFSTPLWTDAEPNTMKSLLFIFNSPSAFTLVPINHVIGLDSDLRATGKIVRRTHSSRSSLLLWIALTTATDNSLFSKSISGKKTLDHRGKPGDSRGKTLQLKGHRALRRSISD